MSKKSALGNIPTFNLNESVAINGIPVSTPTQEVKETKIEEVKTEILNEKAEALTEQLKKKLETRKDITDVSTDLEKYIAEKEAQHEIKFKKAMLPSNKKHLKEGYTRQTFAVKDEHLELIKALASYKGIEQKQLLETLLERAFKDIDEKVKAEALSFYRSEDEESEIDIFN